MFVGTSKAVFKVGSLDKNLKEIPADSYEAACSSFPWATATAKELIYIALWLQVLY
jgi:hypothetical protein